MKDEYKILIGAVIVILIVLVGAFALSGSNNAGPSASPTVIPVTATPTVVPAGNSGTNGGTPTVNPTMAPTVAPTVAPTTEPESGVKQTEFGYWITYPPLGPENWSSPKPPVQGPPNNSVYFDPTSGTLTIGFSNDQHSIDAIVHRKGDLSGTTVVHLRTGTSDNVHLDSLYTNYWLIGNVHFINDTDFTLTFNPGESESPITIRVDDVSDSVELEGASVVPFQGHVQFTIVGVDDGYTYGYNRDYSLNIVTPAVDASGTNVTFRSDYEDIYRSWDSVNQAWYISMHGTGIYQIRYYPGINDTAAMYIPIDRYVDGNPATSGDLDVTVTVASQNASMTYSVMQPHFSDGSSTADVILKIPRAFVLNGYVNRVTIYIQASDNYNVLPIGSMAIYINPILA